MTTRIKRTCEEKEILVTTFLKSGLTLSKWCKDNKIPITTFKGWMQKYKNEVSFISLEPISKYTNTLPDLALDPLNNELFIEFNGFKITVTDHSSVNLLEKVLKVVKSLDV